MPGAPISPQSSREVAGLIDHVKSPIRDKYVNSRPLFEGKDTLPVVLHANYHPTLLFRFVVQRLREGADLGVGQPQPRTIGVFALRIIVQYEYGEPCAVASLRVLHRLPVAGRIAKRRVRSPTYHQVDAFRLSRVVVIQEQLGFLGEKRLAVLVAVFRSARGTDHLPGRNAVHALGNTRTKSWPPPVTMYVLYSLTRRYLSNSIIGKYVS